MKTLWLLMWLSNGGPAGSILTVVELPSQAQCQVTGEALNRLRGYSRGYSFLCIERTM
jgi:hypothetical protein